MHKFLLAACLVGFSIPAMASCDKLKEEIDGKLQAKGTKNYTLEIVPIAAAAPATAANAAPAAAAPATAAASAPAKATPTSAPAVAAAPAKKSAGKIVGTCDGGTKNIIYHRG